MGGRWQEGVKMQTALQVVWGYCSFKVCWRKCEKEPWAEQKKKKERERIRDYHHLKSGNQDVNIMTLSISQGIPLNLPQELKFPDTHIHIRLPTYTQIHTDAIKVGRSKAGFFRFAHKGNKVRLCHFPSQTSTRVCHALGQWIKHAHAEPLNICA